MNAITLRDYCEMDLTVKSVQFVFRRKCTLGWNLKTVSRPLYGLVYLHSGRAEYLFSDKTVYAEKDDIVFFKPGDSYLTNALGEENLEFTVISFELTLDSNVELLPFQTVNRAAHLCRLRELFCYIEEIHFAQKAGCRFHVKGLVQNLISELLQDSIAASESTDPTTRGIKAAADYIEANYDRGFDMTQLATISGYSLSHFRKRFHQIYGTSPVVYVSYVRIQKAKDFLKSGMYSVSEIAELCGYQNVFYFSRAFKKATGISPKFY